MKWCFLITCANQSPRDQMCRYMPSMEKSFQICKPMLQGMDTRVLLWSFWHDRPQSLPRYRPSYKCLKRGFLFILWLSFLLLPTGHSLALPAPLLSLMPCSWRLPEAAAACLCLPLTDGAVSGGQEAPALHTRPGACLALLRVDSALFWHSAHSWKDLSCVSKE